jgi:flagellar biosynthetic protein FlhB
MAEESDLSRTEPASPRRLQQARSQGDVPRSTELTAWVVLAGDFRFSSHSNHLRVVLL